MGVDILEGGCGAVYAVASWAVIPERGGMNVRLEGGIDYLGSAVGVAGLVWSCCTQVSLTLSNGVERIARLVGCDLGAGSWGRRSCSALGIIIGSHSAGPRPKLRSPSSPRAFSKAELFVVVQISLCLGWMLFGMFQFYFPLL